MFAALEDASVNELYVGSGGLQYSSYMSDNNTAKHVLFTLQISQHETISMTHLLCVSSLIQSKLFQNGSSSYVSGRCYSS